MKEVVSDGWISRLKHFWYNGGFSRSQSERHLSPVEVLSLGKRQLILLRCGEEYFLVAGGLDSVNAIVKVSVPTNKRSEQ